MIRMMICMIVIIILITNFGFAKHFFAHRIFSPPIKKSSSPYIPDNHRRRCECGFVRFCSAKFARCRVCAMDLILICMGGVVAVYRTVRDTDLAEMTEKERSDKTEDGQVPPPSYHETVGHVRRWQ